MTARVLLPDTPDKAVYIVISGTNPEPWEIGEVYPVRRGGKLSAGISPSLKLKSYQDDVREQLHDLAIPKIDGNVSIWFWFWRQVESWEDANGHRKTGNYADSTNLQKATEDALQGYVYDNDRYNRLVGSEIVDQGPSVTPAIVVAYREWIMPGEHSQTAISLFQRFVNSVKHNYFDNSW